MDYEGAVNVNEQNEHSERSERLFDELSKKKKQKKRKTLSRVLIVLALVLAAGVAGFYLLRNYVNREFAPSVGDVLSYEVTTGQIYTTASGSGTLEEVDLETLTVPEGVEIDEVLVEAGDTVSQGDLLATVEMATVMTALSDVQDAIDDLDDDIAAAKDDTVSSYVTTGISGRVKILYAQKEDDVAACMVENGALAVLSLDGYMALDLETEALSQGEEVLVYRADGTELTGTVDTVSRGTATILVTDDGPAYDEEVTVKTSQGEDLGGGKLYIHNPLSITGYAGTIRNVSVSENAYVYAGSTVFTLTDTSLSANYDSLLRSRQEKEEELLRLLTIYRDKAVLAPMDGLISTVIYDEDAEDTASAASTASAGTNAEDAETELLTICPNQQVCVTISVDETDILSLQLDQQAQVEVGSVSDETFTGVVTQIHKEASTSSGVTAYSAEITLDKAEGMLAGMTADVEVRIEGVENALIIPLDALHQTRDSAYVYTGYDEQTQQYTGMADVTVGMQNDSYVEILSGLKAGDTVYYTESQSNPFGFPFGNMGNMGNMGGMGGMGGQGGMPGGR